MIDEEKKVDETKTGTDEPIENGDSDYIEQIQKLKASSVSKDEYEKVVQEKKELIKALAEGQTINPENPSTKVDVNKLREELYGDNKKDLTNLDYVKKTLKLRDALIEQGEPDPFLPSGSHTVPTEDDKRSAQQVANTLQNCVDAANGDSNVFTAQLQSATMDSKPLIRRR